MLTQDSENYKRNYNFLKNITIVKLRIVIFFWISLRLRDTSRRVYGGSKHFQHFLTN